MGLAAKLDEAATLQAPVGDGLNVAGWVSSGRLL